MQRPGHGKDRVGGFAKWIYTLISLENHMTQPIIGFIGAGNMTRSLASGLLASGYDANALLLSDPNPALRAELSASLGLSVADDNAAVAARADILVIAVKPQVMQAVAGGLKAAVKQRRPLIITIAAGIRLADLERWLGGNLPVVRVMPNTPALVGAGAAGLYANAQVSKAQRDQAEAILRAVGITVWIEDENLMDIVTAVSGSGPAYFFLVMEALESAAIQSGLSAEAARLLTVQTAFGAAKMALESGEDPGVLRTRVTSPGGTTESALRTLHQGNITELFNRAVIAARDRGRELADQLGKQ
jgi:pyrroline-5-carboxylate reductase